MFSFFQSKWWISHLQHFIHVSLHVFCTINSRDTCFFFVKDQYLKNCHIITHMLHVWYMYPHFPLNVDMFHLSCRLGVWIPLQNGPNPTGGGWGSFTIRKWPNPWICQWVARKICQVIFFNLWCKALGKTSLEHEKKKLLLKILVV